MKKQILILTLFVAAILVGTTSAFAQPSNVEVDYLDAAPTFCPPAIALSCGSTDALHPAPGVPYTYEINSNSVGTIHWFVTDDASIITPQGVIAAGIEAADGSSNYILTAGATYNQAANATATVDITWKSFDGTTNNVLLVAYAIDAAGCTDNIEVYRIEPEYAFTLDIAGILDDGTEGATECVNPIQSASYDGTTEVLTVDYGSNYVFFAVNAANWQTSWMPDDFTASISGNTPSSTVGTPEWAYPDEASGAGSVWNTVGVDEVEASHYASNTNGFIGAAGECIIVRVPVDHGTTVESLLDQTVNLIVNGEMLNPQTSAYDGVYPDLDEAGAGNPCTSDLVTDNFDYVITPRPDVDEVDPTPFEDKTPTDD